MASSKLLNQPRWFRFRPRNLSNVRLFSDLPSQHPVSVSEPQKNIDSKSNNRFNKASSTPSSLKEPELAKFSAIADTWWDSEGPFKPLHKMNPTRLAFIRSTLCRHFGTYLLFSFSSQPLAQMGATVTGIDAVDKNIKITYLHVDLDPTTSTIEYCCTTTEKLVDKQRKFDVVIALEVIEHVADPAEFCKSLAALTVHEGTTVVSTINRSMRSYSTAIVAAEYLLQWNLDLVSCKAVAVYMFIISLDFMHLPQGMHQWSSFLTPEEQTMILKRASIDVKEMTEFVYNPLTERWSVR
ncbi:hypothetical protein CRYUN_Cryun17cG0050000 [Craigia yunnanensis]